MNQKNHVTTATCAVRLQKKMYSNTAFVHKDMCGTIVEFICIDDTCVPSSYLPVVFTCATCNQNNETKCPITRTKNFCSKFIPLSLPQIIIQRS